MGDAELMSAALLLDVGLYYAGLVIPAYENPERALLEFPFQGRPGRIVAAMVKFYQRRFVALGKRRWATGYHGRNNAGWRELYVGFSPDPSLWKLVRKGLFRWWRAELTNIALMLRSGARPSAAQNAAATAEACES